MKKIYVSPATVGYSIATRQLICVSRRDVLDATLDEELIDPSTNPYSGKFQARRHDLWEDEELDDED